MSEHQLLPNRATVGTVVCFSFLFQGTGVQVDTDLCSAVYTTHQLKLEWSEINISACSDRGKFKWKYSPTPFLLKLKKANTIPTCQSCRQEYKGNS